MPTDFNKVLEKIQTDNTALLASQAQLARAYEKLDSRITVIKAGVRIEPYEVKKGGPKLGFRRFDDGWHITTMIEGIGGLTSEVPVSEAVPTTQVELVAHVGPLIDKIATDIAGRRKNAEAAVKEADKILAALP